jgi:hypothetical protein
VISWYTVGGADQHVGVNVHLMPCCYTLDQDSDPRSPGSQLLGCKDRLKQELGQLPHHTTGMLFDWLHLPDPAAVPSYTGGPGS